MPLSHISTWIFDMDDTLYPHNLAFIKAMRARFSEYIQEKNDISAAEVEEKIALYAEKYTEPKLGFIKEMNFCLDEWQDIVLPIASELLTACERTAELLGHLPGKKVICTNASDRYTRHVLEHLKLAAHWDHVDDFVSRGHLLKPETEVYENLLRDTGARAENCAFFEDKEINLKPAKELGMTTVLVGPKKPTSNYVTMYRPTLLDWLEEFTPQLPTRKAS